MSTLTVREGSEEPINLQALQDLDGDGIAEAPIDLSGVTTVELRLKKISDGAIVVHSTTDNPAKLVILDAFNGKLTFTPSTTDWNIADVGFYTIIKIVDATAKTIYVPENVNQLILIKEAI